MRSAASINMLNAFLPVVAEAYSKFPSLPKITIENFADFVSVPVGLAGPLNIWGLENTDGEFVALLATVELTLVASCSRGYKAFNECGGLHFDVLREDMSRAPVFCFASPGEATTFAQRVPSLKDQFAEDAETTSRYTKLQTLTPHIIGSNVHVKVRLLLRRRCRTEHGHHRDPNCLQPVPGDGQ
jgi:hydroxymethylglutaryl-CoA reductase